MHAAERRAGAHRAEQVLALGDGVPADHDLVVDRLRHALAVERRDRAHERLGGAPRVEHLALADRAGADRGAQVVVAADRQHGAARLRQRVAGRAERRAGEGRLGQQPGAARPTTRASRPTSRASAGRASRCARRATAPRPARRRAGARPTRRRSASARRARSPRALSRSQRYFATVRSARERQPGGPAEAPGSPPSIRAASLLAARVVPGDRRAPPARRGGRAARRSRPCPTTPTPTTRLVGRLGERLARRRQRAVDEPLRTRSRRRSAPASSAAAPGRARSPRPPG